MASQRKIQKSSINFRKNNPGLYNSCCGLLKGMANFILKTGSSEVTVGIKNGKYYETANQ